MSIYSNAYEATANDCAYALARLVEAGQELVAAARRVADAHGVEALDVIAAYEVAF
jgi:hypothetical protein